MTSYGRLTFMETISNSHSDKADKALVLSKRKAAESLLKDANIPLFHAFTQEPRSAKDIATEFQLDIRKALYYINKWLELGLLKITKEVKRGGRAIKYYQVAAEAFIIPYNLLGVKTPKDFLDLVEEPYYNTIARNAFPEVYYEDAGLEVIFFDKRYNKLLIFKDKGSWSRGLPLPPPYDLNLLEWQGFKLSLRQAQNFTSELKSLVKHYKTMPIEEPNDRYLLNIRMVNVHKDF